jgi:serine O-acetyltransferase
MQKKNTEQLVSGVLSRLEVFGKISKPEKEAINLNLLEAITETNKIIGKYNKIPKTFNLLQTHHSAVFFYKLAQTLQKNEEYLIICEKLYLLNRMLNGLDLFYKIKMPDFFLIGHGLGTVFSNSIYGNYLVVFQNVTIAFQDNFYPEISEKVVIYPNSIIAGNTHIGSNCVIGAGTRLINKVIPDNSIVYEKGSKLIIKPNDRNEIGKYFDVEFLD